MWAGLAQDAEPVRLKLEDGGEPEARYVTGADGAHSTVRDLVEVGFAGAAHSLPMLLADVRIPASEPPPITQAGTRGVVVTLPFGDGWFGVGAWLRDRPDGYVAWAGDRAGIEAAPVKWCGPADHADRVIRTAVRALLVHHRTPTATWPAQGSSTTPRTRLPGWRSAGWRMQLIRVPGNLLAGALRHAEPAGEAGRRQGRRAR
ncbi:2-polyprenyl-6-methoxyphenol hydroxylase-like FAD-dependent oxidoreductase [Nonomuraea thailandensis]|uniref:2-polyprenyl-6-methoxyphenol hydroxylase-like FAD-dependent oxidoreductase n=1 Tax=Nonomuraea thailandensis TaxID=1188745 RepID=A0A9X2GMA5_9ACTN|nr:FAD-dependent monooxygenase [Nonomuraea thailandensis]MCP2358171.1 2-polyprenyl-6-methoxyphenol hydroxylase-like FAD-dependent oxidoreductase [Nonomuraea thailandensis]